MECFFFMLLNWSPSDRTDIFTSLFSQGGTAQCVLRSLLSLSSCLCFTQETSEFCCEHVRYHWTHGQALDTHSLCDG